MRLSVVIIAAMLATVTEAQEPLQAFPEDAMARLSELAKVTDDWEYQAGELEGMRRQLKMSPDAFGGMLVRFAEDVGKTEGGEALRKRALEWLGAFGTENVLPFVSKTVFEGTELEKQAAFNSFARIDACSSRTLDLLRQALAGMSPIASSVAYESLDMRAGTDHRKAVIEYFIEQARVDDGGAGTLDRLLLKNLPEWRFARARSQMVRRVFEGNNPYSRQALAGAREELLALPAGVLADDESILRLVDLRFKPSCEEKSE